MHPIRLLVALATLAAPIPCAAQGTTSWGDPDLQGIWTNQTPVPMERPDTLAGKAFFTEQEAADFERTALERLLKRFGPAVPLSGELNEIWLETQHGKVPATRRTSLVVDPPDGKIPYTPSGRARWDALPNFARARSADGPEDRDLAERCITTNGLFAPNPFYNNYHQIFQTPGYLVILTEMMHEVRIIPLDQRPHLGPGVRLWLGDSRGRWEDDTLIVETTNFNDRKVFQGATEQLRILERFRRLDANTIEYRLTVTDPATFTGPWTIENALRKAEGRLYEVDCHEGNYGLAGILSGARAEEAR